MKKLNEALDLFNLAKARIEDIEARLFVQERYLKLHDDANIWLFHTRADVSNKITELKADRNFYIQRMISSNELVKMALLNLI
jgi:hypothetical protein